MSFDSRFSLAKKAEVSKNYKSGIVAQGIDKISSEAYLAERRNNTPWAPWARNALEAGAAPKKWCDADNFLVKKFGTSVNYSSGSFYETSSKVIGRYSSNGVQGLLERTKTKLKESDLLKGVNVITEDCNLKGTNIEELTDLKKIWGNLTLDTSSALKKIDGLCDIGKLTVIAKNEAEMAAFLKRIGLMAQDGSIKTTIRNGIHFVMKNYL